MKIGLLLKALLLLIVLGTFTGCPWVDENRPSAGAPNLSFVVWKPDGSGFITVVSAYVNSFNTSSLAIYDSAGTLLKTYPLTFDPAPVAGVVAFVHQGNDLIAPQYYGSSLISLNDGAVSSFSQWYLRGIDPSGHLMFLGTSEYYPDNSQPYSPVAIADSLDHYDFVMKRQWNQPLIVNSSMVWTSPTTFSLLLFDSTNAPAIVEFDTSLKQIASVSPPDMFDLTYRFGMVPFFYSSAVDRYYISTYSTLLSVDRKTGTQNTIETGSRIENLTGTTDGHYIAYSFFDSTGHNNTRILNTVSGAKGLLPKSDSHMALSPNGLHFAYSATETPGPLMHVVNVTLP